MEHFKGSGSGYLFLLPLFFVTLHSVFFLFLFPCFSEKFEAMSLNLVRISVLRSGLVFVGFGDVFLRLDSISMLISLQLSTFSKLLFSLLMHGGL